MKTTSTTEISFTLSSRAYQKHGIFAYTAAMEFTAHPTDLSTPAPVIRWKLVKDLQTLKPGNTVFVPSSTFDNPESAMRFGSQFKVVEVLEDCVIVEKKFGKEMIQGKRTEVYRR